MSGLRRYLSELSLSKVKKRRQRTASESDASSVPKSDELKYSGRRRRVTFADLEDLSVKHGSNQTLNTHVESHLGISNIGYININCAEQFEPHHKEEHIADEHVLLCPVKSAKQYEIITSMEEDCEHNIVVSFGTKGNGNGQFQDATNITYANGDLVFVTDMINNKLQLSNRAGKTSTVYTGQELTLPWATCITSDRHIAVTSLRRKCVMVLSMEGDVLWSFGIGFFKSPCGICVDDNDNIIVTDTGSKRVSMHTAQGKFIRYLQNQDGQDFEFCRPRYVYFSSPGDIIVSDSGSHSIKIFDDNGRFLRSFGKFGKKDGEMKSPYGVCTDKLGHVIVADHYNNRISMFTRDGIFLCHVIQEANGLVHPKGVALSPDLSLFVSHGHLKASEVKVFKLQCFDPTEIAHV